MPTVGNVYRTHTCGELRPDDAGRSVRLSGWVDRKRDHGSLLFLDLRDHFGVTQCVVDTASPHFGAAQALRPESVVTVTGTVKPRSPETVNPDLATGAIELAADGLVLQSTADPLPLQLHGAVDPPE